ncbi:MAG: 1-acyl-sn-glycerol-3-phosphate acyltransferase [Lachnospiraceae bacterium]|nr:1-acyl-sn-glycerol-3-phosphate acyltransferase [Lachnospiraceae bacterium]
MIRSILVLLFFILFFLGFFPVVLLLYLIRCFSPDLERRITLRIIQAFLSFELIVSGTTVIPSGLENIPEKEAVLFVGNHRSDFDALVTYKYMKQPTGYVAKIELSRIPIMAQWMDLLECVFMDRKNVREGVKAISDAAEKVKKGISIFIFPEGTRNHNEDRDIPMEFHKGSLKIVQKAECRIVPVAIQDTEKIFEEHVPYITAQTVKVRFCEPVDPQTLTKEQQKNLSGYIREIIADELQKMRQEDITA